MPAITIFPTSSSTTSSLKIVGGDCNQAADDFLDWLNRFSNNHGVKFTVSVSGDPGLATDGMQKYL